MIGSWKLKWNFPAKRLILSASKYFSWLYVSEGKFRASLYKKHFFKASYLICFHMSYCHIKVRVQRNLDCMSVKDNSIQTCEWLMTVKVLGNIQEKASQSKSWIHYYNRLQKDSYLVDIINEIQKTTCYVITIALRSFDHEHLLAAMVFTTFLFLQVSLEDKFCSAHSWTRFFRSTSSVFKLCHHF